MSADVLYLNGRFLAQRVTGVQRYATEALLALDRLLADRPRRVVLLTPRGAEAPPLRHIEVRQVGRLTGHLWEQLSLPLAARGGLLLGFAANGPLLVGEQIVTVHDAAVRAAPAGFSWAYRTYYRSAIRWLGRRARLVLTVSEFSKAELVSHFGVDPERLRVTSEGHEHILRAVADDEVLPALGLQPGAYVLAVSSRAPNKNFRLLVDALARFDEPPCEVVIAGGVDDRVFGGSALAAHPKVHQAGYVDDAQLRALYTGAALFVFPSTYEGFGLPPIEAMACGCPVASSDAASLPEVCGDAAVYFSPDDAGQLADAIDAVMGDAALRADLRDRGRARAAGFRWDDCAERILAAVDECRAGGAAGVTP